jgi:hypothetical protein
MVNLFRNQSRAFVSTLILLVAMTGAAHAGDIIRLFGEENVGTAGGQFLRVPVGARAVALAKSYSALATDGSALFWNPAGIMRSPGRKNYFASHSEYTAGIDMDFASFHMRGQNFGYGVSMGVLRSGDILRTDEFHQQGTGQYFNANQFYIGGSLARAMTDRFSIGGTVKYYQENLDEYQLKSVLADMGILFLVGQGDLSIGFSVRNFGGSLQPDGSPPAMPDGYIPAADFQKFSAPTTGAFGVAKTWGLSEKVGLLTTAEFNHPSDYRESFRFGGELEIKKMLFLRTGFETSREEGGFAAGFGVQLLRKQFQLRIDYAFSDLGSFGTIHHISVDLSPLYKRKYGQRGERGNS